MMSGDLWWGNGGTDRKGTSGYFWASTPNSYANSRGLDFGSANVYPKYNSNKPYGFALRCVTRNQKLSKKLLTATSLLYKIILVHFEQKLTASRLYT
ncbi:hypothetical protein IKF63_02625 [Candidatus Saccharibacteria bacterium]|nr:hypothetical protein [Candidatus Saccharibacteria bacterium]